MKCKEKDMLRRIRADRGRGDEGTGSQEENE